MINEDLFSFQKIGVLVVVAFAIGFSMFFFKPSNLYSKNDVKLDVNKATFKELVAVPYIGKKTALKILKLRKKLGYIKDISQLKKVRNFNKFKYYLKVENNAS